MTQGFDGRYGLLELEGGSAAYYEPSLFKQERFEAFGPGTGQPGLSYANHEQDMLRIPTLRVNEPADPADATAYGADDRVARLFLEAAPAVVHLKAERDKLEGGTTRTVDVTGSGFFITPDGKLATAYHVVRDVKNLRVETADGRRFRATVEEVDPASDLAIVKVQKAHALQSFQVLPLADSSRQLNRGEMVVAIGHPRGWNDMYVSPGTFRTTRLLRDILPELKGGGQPGEDLNRILVESTIHVETGNSGGPKLDSKGRVIGVIGLTNSRDTGEATPVEDLLRLLNRSQRNLPASLSVDLPKALPGDTPPAGTNKPAFQIPGLSGEAPPKPGYGDIPGFRFPGASPSPEQAPKSVDKPPIKLPDKNGVELKRDYSIKSEEMPSFSHTLVHGVNIASQFAFLGRGKPGVIGGALSVASGGYDLIFKDLPELKRSFQSSSSGDVLAAGAQVGADALLIGGGLASFSQRGFVAGSLAAIAGSGIKVVADGLKYTRLFS